MWHRCCPACLTFLLWEWWPGSLLSLKRPGKWVVLDRCSHLSGGCSALLTLLKERWEFLFCSLYFLSWGMETLFNLKQVVLRQRNNAEEEVSGEINYPQSDNNLCCDILPVYILLLLTILPFFLLFFYCVDCLEQFWNLLAIWEWHEAPPFLQWNYLLSFDESRKGGVLNPSPFVL